MNKLEDEYRSKDEGSVDGEKYHGTTGGKFIFSKRDPSSMNEMFIEQGSVGTDIQYEKSGKFVQSKSNELQLNSD